MTKAELDRHADAMATKGRALLYMRLVELITQGQKVQDPAVVMDMISKLEDMQRARWWDDKLGKTILETKDPSLLGKGPGGKLLHKLTGEMQKVKKAAGGDGRATGPKTKKSHGLQALPPDEV